MMRLLQVTVVVGLVVAPVMADWNPGDPYKMHFPQLPDPQGWDVNATMPKVLADDWGCTETGPVSDIHVWGSWRQDIQSPIAKVHVSIHANVPAPPFSHPANPPLWERDFAPGEFTVREYGTGPQGWYNPNTGFWVKPDHFLFHQINIENIPNPFIQHFGTIYWLDVSVVPLTPSAEWGWKTSYMHWEDDAVWGDLPNPQWEPLHDPITGQTLDMAFVITPEPASLGLLALGALVLLRRR